MGGECSEGQTARRETFYSPHKARSLKDYSKVEIFQRPRRRIRSNKIAV